MYRDVDACSWPAGKVKWASQGAVRGARHAFLKYRHTRMSVRLSVEARTVRLKGPMKQPPWHRGGKRK
jgi:hypothetical protein